MGKKADKRSSETKPKKNDEETELKIKMKKLEKRAKAIDSEEDSSEPDTSDFEMEDGSESGSEVDRQDEKLEERKRVAKMMTEMYDPENAEHRLKCKISMSDADMEEIMSDIDELLAKSEHYRDKLARRIVDSGSASDRHFYKKVRSLMETMNVHIATLKILLDDFE